MSLIRVLTMGPLPPMADGGGFAPAISDNACPDASRAILWEPSSEMLAQASRILAKESAGRRPQAVFYAGEGSLSASADGYRDSYRSRGWFLDRVTYMEDVIRKGVESGWEPQDIAARLDELYGYKMYSAKPIESALIRVAAAYYYAKAGDHNLAVARASEAKGTFESRVFAISRYLDRQSEILGHPPDNELQGCLSIILAALANEIIGMSLMAMGMIPDAVYPLNRANELVFGAKDIDVRSVEYYLPADAIVTASIAHRSAALLRDATDILQTGSYGRLDGLAMQLWLLKLELRGHHQLGHWPFTVERIRIIDRFLSECELSGKELTKKPPQVCDFLFRHFLSHPISSR